MRAAVLLVIWLAAAPPCLARRKAAASATRGGEKPVNVVMLRPRFLAPLIPSEVAARPAGMGRDAARLALTIDAGEAGLKGELDSLADALPASRPVDISPADVAQLARRAAPRAGGTGPPGAPTREGAAAARRALAGLMDAAECTDAAVFDAAAAVRGGSDESGGGRRHRCPKAMFRLAVELKSGGAIDSAAEALGALEAQEAEAAAAAAGGRAGAPGPAARARAAARGALLRLLRGAVCRPPMTPERKRAARSQAVDSFLAAAEGRGSGLGSPDFDDSTIAATITHLSGVSVMAGVRAARAGARGTATPAADGRALARSSAGSLGRAGPRSRSWAASNGREPLPCSLAPLAALRAWRRRPGPGGGGPHVALPRPALRRRL